MSKVKKRALSLLLAVLMVFNLVPQLPALAGAAAKDTIEAAIVTLSNTKRNGTFTASFSNATTSDAWSDWVASNSDATASNAVKVGTIKGTGANDVTVATPSVAEGIITIGVALKDGVTVIGTKDVDIPVTVTFPGYKATGTFHVTIEGDSDKEPIPVDSVSLSKTELTLIEGNKETLIATVEPKDATNKDVRWSSNKPEVASVNKDGEVVAVKEGVATITVTTVDGNRTATCDVKVTPKAVPVDSVTLDQPDITLEEGSSTAIGAIILPENATNKNVIWKTSDEAIAKFEVIKEGEYKGRCSITGVKAGDAEVTVTTVDGNKTATCKVKVIPKKSEIISVKGVAINDEAGKEVKDITLTNGKGIKLVAVVKPENADNKAVEWFSSNEDYVTVDQNGYVTAKKVTEENKPVVISVETIDGGFVAECEVKVTADLIAVEGVKLATVDENGNITNIDENGLVLDKAEEETLRAIVLPTNATNQDVNWTTSDSKTVSIDEKGNIKGIERGVATITATTVDGKYQASCKVVVKDLIFHLSRTEVSMQLGVLNEKQLSVVVDMMRKNDVEENIIDGATWKSSDETVATVTDGLVTIHKAGTATITATYDGKYDTCKINVTEGAINGKNNAAKADALQAEVKKLEALTGAEKATAVKKVVNEAAAIVSNVSRSSTTDTNAIQAIDELEKNLAEAASEYVADIQSDVDPEVEAVVGKVSVVGAILNALNEALNGSEAVTPVFTVAPVDAQDKIEDNNIPSENAKPVALDIDLKLIQAGGKDITPGTFAKPIIITMKVPDGFLGINDMVMYHFHGVGYEKLAVKKDSLGNISFSVSNFSTFVLAEGKVTNNNDSGPSGHGGHSSSGGGISTGNLAGTWVQDATGWWFKTTTNGFPANEWAKINNKWYHFNEAGYMQTGWININNVWYYLNADGSMADNTWVLLNDKWYYLNVGGGMLASQWFQYKSQWYYLNADGSMAVSTTTPDGNAVDANGVWVQ